MITPCRCHSALKIAAAFAALGAPETLREKVADADAGMAMGDGSDTTRTVTCDTAIAFKSPYVVVSLSKILGGLVAHMISYYFFLLKFGTMP